MSKSGMRKGVSGVEAGASLAKVLMSIVAVGVAGGAALIAGANKVGGMIENKRKKDAIASEKAPAIESEVVIDTDIVEE